MSTQGKASWIAADWGTSNLRIWAMDGAGNPFARRSSGKGMGKLARNEFEPALLELIGDILDEGSRTPVIVCGMAGARQGWVEAPYKAAPCAPPSLEEATRVDTQDTRLDVLILPGVLQHAPADVMRGEETQTAGVLAEDPDFHGVLCLPGTHTKWAIVGNGEIISFRTMMTGEVFALLSGHSVLRHGLSQDALEAEAFAQAVREAFETPAQLTAGLFGIRAAGLIAGLTPEAARGRLSGLLIGAELAAVQNDIANRPVAIVGTDRIAKTYESALECVGFDTSLLDGDSITLKGLSLAFSSFSKEPS
ncbi:2-dehydro-3-deoxygalactonokinase [Roseibium aggregatum]|uniref:2-dehydro-3-deoxygalactonokinase n=1 Tax=Roseibium aggregatum TaxID=187304 RepID=A0A939J532_9HYPH|nr:2-dehydro-3-deoxygalactonokinase [Roseibium aggregatum]MBN9671805.1 2-dehydro-3-deoxygalactonokinase [Roseibium aggregatum]